MDNLQGILIPNTQHIKVASKLNPKHVNYNLNISPNEPHMPQNNTHGTPHLNTFRFYQHMFFNL